MANTQIEAVGTAEDIARAAYQAGFGDGYEAARMVIEVLVKQVPVVPGTSAVN